MFSKTDVVCTSDGTAWAHSSLGALRWACWPLHTARHEQGLYCYTSASILPPHGANVSCLHCLLLLLLLLLRHPACVQAPWQLGQQSTCRRAHTQPEHHCIGPICCLRSAAHAVTLDTEDNGPADTLSAPAPTLLRTPPNFLAGSWWRPLR